MSDELEKIRFFFDEGARLWSTDPERVIGRQFYELWEEIQRPRPFEIPDGPVKILGESFDTPEDEPGRIAHFRWDHDEAAPSLVVEGRNYTQKFLLSFDDGAPLIQDTDPVLLNDTDMPFGERLDIVYDVIDHVKKNFPGREILSMTKKEFLEYLDGISERHGSDSIAEMRKSSAQFIRMMLRNAAEDMATDELSDQLSLALDGTYSAVGAASEPAEVIRVCAEKDSEVEIPPRSPWTIANDLEFLSLATRKAMEAEQEFVLGFKDARVLRLKDNEAVLEVPASRSMPLAEGDVLAIYERGVTEKAGTFTVDLFDGTKVYGKLRADSIALEGDFCARIFARPVRSSRALLAASFEILIDDHSKGYFARNSSAIGAMLGMEVAKYARRTPVKAPADLDHSQKTAWGAATDPANRIVLVQGPPGTGKTRLLEAVLRTLCENSLRILLTAPSNTALDNICRRARGLPLLRFGAYADAIAPDILENHWINDNANIRKFTELRDRFRGGGIYAGTHVGLVKNPLLDKDVAQNGLFDIILFDEAGMSRMEEFLLCARYASRAVLFGDHQQLPPFPLPEQVLSSIGRDYGPMSRHLRSLISDSALEWLAAERKFPVTMLQRSYRCQNPRLLRFCSTLFYDATVKTSAQAEYYRLPYAERQKTYPNSTVRLYRTSGLPEEIRRERLLIEGDKPGFENAAEARICAVIVYEKMERYPLSEITVITPYRRQIRLLRSLLDFARAKEIVPGLAKDDWDRFLKTRIATVDSFQGGESDVVIISYVRSNSGDGIGFVDDPNRVNVAHTRCRREMMIVGDIECLKSQARNNIFHRMERAIARDGEIINVETGMLESLSGGRSISEKIASTAKRGK